MMLNEQLKDNCKRFFFQQMNYTNERNFQRGLRQCFESDIDLSHPTKDGVGGGMQMYHFNYMAL